MATEQVNTEQVKKISQRDLRLRSKEIMDAVESGESYTVTRDGHAIGQLVPLRERRRFVTRAAFAATSHTAPGFDLDLFRRDQEAVLAQDVDDPYAR